MARIGARDFVGARARLQRYRDARIFNCWIEELFGSTIDLSTNSPHPVEIGDEFRVEGFGHHIKVVFNARLESVGKLDIVNSGILTAVEGGNARVLEARSVSLTLALSSQIKFISSDEALRLRCVDKFLSVTCGSIKTEGLTQDVGPGGIGAVLKKQLPVGQAARVVVATNVGDVAADVAVRYSRPDNERQGYFRTGFMITDLGRIERLKWDRFLKEFF